MFINLSWRKPLSHPRLEKPTVEAPILTQTQSKSLAKKGQLVARWVKVDTLRSEDALDSADRISLI